MDELLTETDDPLLTEDGEPLLTEQSEGGGDPMNVLRVTAAAVISATASFAIRHVRLVGAADDTATLENGAGAEIARLVIGTVEAAPDDLALSAPLYTLGLEVATLSASAILFIYVE